MDAMTSKTSTRRAESAGAAAVPLTVEHLPIAALHPDPGNPSRNGEDELAALTRSIATFGVVDPVLARRADRHVIAGHQRLVAARRAGLTTVPVILLDLPVEDARLLNVALNQIGWVRGAGDVGRGASDRRHRQPERPDAGSTKSSEGDEASHRAEDDGQEGDDAHGREEASRAHGREEGRPQDGARALATSPRC